MTACSRVQAIIIRDNMVSEECSVKCWWKVKLGGDDLWTVKFNSLLIITVTESEGQLICDWRLFASQTKGDTFYGASIKLFNRATKPAKTVDFWQRGFIARFKQKAVETSWMSAKDWMKNNVSLCKWFNLLANLLTLSCMLMTQNLFTFSLKRLSCILSASSSKHEYTN